MRNKTEQFLGLLFWSFDVMLQPTFRNLTDSFESWAYRNGLYRQARRLETLELIERDVSKPDERLYRLTNQGRLHVLGGRDPEEQWERPWDGNWYVVVFDVPIRRTAWRVQLRRYLRSRGMGCLQGSVYITPTPLETERKLVVNREANVKSLFLLKATPYAGEADADIVEGAWDFQEINRNYMRHRRILSERPNVCLGSEKAAQGLLRWAEEERRVWLEAVRLDPLLPKTLWPSDYLGERQWKQRMEALREARKLVEAFGSFQTWPMSCGL